MSVGALLSILFGSMLGALIPIVNVELIVVIAAREYGHGPGPAIAVSLVAAFGTMLGKLQVYAVARGGRALGGKWVQRRTEREAKHALEQAEERAHAAEDLTELEHSIEEGALPEAALPSLPRRAWIRTKRAFAGPGAEKLGLPMVGLSALVGIPPFAITAALAGVARMRWYTFFLAGLGGRFLRFLLVYEGAAQIFHL